MDARDPPTLAARATAGLSPPKRVSAKADKRGHDESNIVAVGINPEFALPAIFLL